MQPTHKRGIQDCAHLEMQKREQMKTTRCLIYHKNFLFENILYHLKNTQNAWEHIKISPRPVAKSPTPMFYEEKDLQVENGRIAPSPTPEQEQEVPEEIEKIVQELRNLEQATEKIQQTENSRTADSTEHPMDLNEINSEDLIKFDNFDFNLLLL